MKNKSGKHGHVCYKINIKKKKREQPTTHSIPRRSPIQVLTVLDVA